MKFETDFDRHKIPEFYSHYFDYAEIKEAIHDLKRKLESSPVTSPNDFTFHNNATELINEEQEGE